MKQAEQNGDYVIQAVIKTFDVLFAFRDPPHRFTLAELSRKTGLGKNQTYRCIKSLEHYGVVRSDEEGRFLLTGALYSLAVHAIEESSIIQVAQPFMDQLARETGESINLIALVDGMAVAVDRRESSAGVRLATRLGARVPLHAGAVPKAILAHLPREEQEKVLGMLPFLTKYTEKTVTDPERLRAELAEIRRRGFSISDEDFERGARGAGAPIFDSSGSVIAGISAGGPTVRVDDARLQEFGERVRQAARQISRQLGYLGG